MKENKAQSSIEFSLAFIVAILFLVLTCNLFVWLNHNMVARQMGYEQTRKAAASTSEPGKLDFYPQEKMKKLNVFVPGGYGDETY